MKFWSCPWLRRRRNPGLDSNLAREEKGENSRREGSEACEKETEEESGEEVEREVEQGAREKERERRQLETPPDDDVCPICFGSFAVPCRAPCGHWFCGDCILQYWNHGAALKPCKCPMCSQQIIRLIPKASLDISQNVKVLKDVQKYNRLFVGGIYGLFLKASELPLLVKRIFREMMDPDAHNDHLLKARIFAMLLGAFYSFFSPFQFLPTEGINTIDLFDRIAIALVFILHLVGLYWRRRRLQTVRRLAAAQLEAI
ncbi:hypothetical protein NMG60_11036780 [Bertholletia excelsa]